MKDNVKIIIGYLFLSLLLNQPTYAQIAQTKDAIIKKNGANYKSGVADNGMEYIYYEDAKTKTLSAFYFAPVGDGVKACIQFRMSMPILFLNSTIESLNGLNTLKQVSDTKWIEQDKSIYHEIIVEKERFTYLVSWYNQK